MLLQSKYKCTERFVVSTAMGLSGNICTRAELPSVAEKGKAKKAERIY